MTSMTGFQPAMNATGKAPKMKSPSGYKFFQQFTPEQMQLFNQSFGQLSPQSYLGRLAGGDQNLFGEMEAPQLRQFSEMLGGIGSRFAGMGTGGLKSSGFRNTNTAAASNFAQELGSRRQALQQQAIKDLIDMSQGLLGQRPYGLIEKEPSFFDKWLQLAGNVMGTASKASPGFF